MNKKHLKLLGISFLMTFLASLSWGHVKILHESALAKNCTKIGYFEGDAGYGKSLDGKRIALYRAQRAAALAGANSAILIELDRGITDMGGYCLLEAYHCPNHKIKHDPF